MDISNGFNSVINFILNGVKFCFDFLDNITFNGISMLDFLITLFVLGVALPIVISIVTARPVIGDYRFERSRNGQDESGNIVDH